MLNSPDHQISFESNSVDQESSVLDSSLDKDKFEMVGSLESTQSGITFPYIKNTVSSSHLKQLISESSASLN